MSDQPGISASDYYQEFATQRRWYLDYARITAVWLASLQTLLIAALSTRFFDKTKLEEPVFLLLAVAFASITITALGWVTINRCEARYRQYRKMMAEMESEQIRALFKEYTLTTSDHAFAHPSKNLKMLLGCLSLAVIVLAVLLIGQL